jgi:hypothetical protein
MNFSGQKHALILVITDTQVQLLHWRAGALSILQVYGKSPEDIEAFAEEISSYHGLPVVVVADFIEENFRYDTVVHVSGRDQQALLKRKMDFAFRNTAYRRSKVIEREAEGRRDDKILLSAISKPESVEAWINVLLEQKFAIQSVTSVAYILETFISLRKKTAGSFFLITNLEHGNNLRQTFFKDGLMLFSRLTTLTGREPTQIGDDIYRETIQLRQYFERIQFLAYDAPLHVEVYVPHNDSMLQLENKSGELNRIQVMDTNTLAVAKPGDGTGYASPTHYFLSEVLAHKRPANIYAPPANTRFHDLKTLGYQFAFGASMLLLLTFAINIPMAVNIREQWEDRDALQQQIAPLQSQYDALVNNFPAIPAPSQEMELVVLTHEKISQQIHSPVAAMNMISNALASSSGLLLTAINWSLVETPVDALDEAGGLQNIPVPLLEGLGEDNNMLAYILDKRSHIKIIIEGLASSPSSFREAQDKVSNFVAALSANPGTSVYASRMPTDVRTDISVATMVTDGEIRAPFTLELTLVSPQ